MPGHGGPEKKKKKRGVACGGRKEEKSHFGLEEEKSCIGHGKSAQGGGGEGWGKEGLSATC